VRTEFLEEYPGVDVSLQSTGTGGSEREQCGQNGIEPVELRVATDALTVVVNNDADWVDCLTVAELDAIWGPDGADRWSEVRDEWPDEAFELYGPASTSGTFDYFTESVVGEEDAHRESYSPTEDDNTIVTGVQGSEYAMGYLGFAHYQGNSEAVKAVAVDDGGQGCVGPSLETAAGGSYTPLSRPLYIYVNKSALARRSVAEFCRFYVNNTTSRELVADAVEYVPLTEEQRTLVITVGSALIVLPVGVLTAVYLSEYASERTRSVLKPTLEVLAGVPTVVYGLLGVAVFVRFGGLSLGAVVAGGFTLSLLILPIVIVTSQEAIRSVPDSLREASYGMGATRWQTVRYVVLPRAVPGILTSTILALGRAVGETAPLIMVGLAPIGGVPGALTEQGTAMPLQVFAWALDARELFREHVAAAGALTLLVTLVALNGTAVVIRNKYQREQ